MRIILFVVIFLVSSFASADESATVSKEKCKEIYQGWVFNRVLEDLCEIGGVASMKIGVMAKSLCDNVLTEDDRNEYGAEVFHTYKDDLDKLGKERICEIEVPRYNKMLETLYE